MHKLIFALILGAIMLPTHAFALGLGEIHVNSALNQKLDARISLVSAAPEDAEILIVGLASREEFIKAGVDRPHSLTELRFKAVVEEKNIYISVTSPSPIRDPSINFLVEIDWPTGHLIREYIVLLEPPGFMKKGIKKAASPSNRPAMNESISKAQQPENDSFRPSKQSYEQ